MNIRSTQPRKARIALIGLAAAGLSFLALPGAVEAQYPPSGETQEQAPPPLPDQVPPAQVSPSGGALTSADSLPATGGADPTQILLIASGALLAGAAITGASMRRRNADTPAV